MSLEPWVAFVIASTILVVLPGPTILTAISYSISHGKRVRIPLVSAVALGDAAALALSLLGLGVLLEQSAAWFQILKWVGGLYLIYLGYRLFVSAVKPQDLPEARVISSSWKLFANTFIITALNPKGIVFFIAFLPHFISASGDLTQQRWILAITFIVIASINVALYITFADAARRLLASEKAQRRFNFCGGSLLAAAGLWALSAKRTI
jgi:threonine/homoserine/homoserine lactone efflux protein